MADTGGDMHALDELQRTARGIIMKLNPKVGQLEHAVIEERRVAEGMPSPGTAWTDDVDGFGGAGRVGGGAMSRAATQALADAALEEIAQLETLARDMERGIRSQPLGERPKWNVKLQQLRETTGQLRGPVMTYLRAVSEREQLLGGGSGARHGAQGGDASAEAALGKESGHIKRSHHMLDDIERMANNAMETLHIQRESLLGARRKILDVANSVGLSRSIIQVIVKREYWDRVFIYAGMVGILLVIMLLWWYF